MTTRKLVALGTALAFISLSGIGFAADTKATGNAPAATSTTTGTHDPGTTQPKSSTKKKKHSTSSSSHSSGSSGSSGTSATPAPKN